MKYEIRKGTFEFRPHSWLVPVTVDEIAEAYAQQDVYESETIATYDTREEAAEVMRRQYYHYANTRRLSSHGVSYLECTIVYIESNEYDEDEEWIGGGDMYDFIAVPYAEDEEG